MEKERKGSLNVLCAISTKQLLKIYKHFATLVLNCKTKNHV
jgi:hypothetical protein